MIKSAFHHSFVSILAAAGLAVLAQAGCDGGGDGGSGVQAAACSSCQVAFTEAECKEWGERAGCEEATVSDDDTCTAGIAGCAFKNCDGAPICDDAGEASCASCGGSLSQADCDGIAESAGCSGAATGMFNACGSDVTGCLLEGCDFQPSCP